MAVNPPIPARPSRLPPPPALLGDGPPPPPTVRTPNRRRRLPRIGGGTVAAVLAALALLACLGHFASLPLAAVLFAALIVVGSFVRPDVTFMVVLLTAPLVYPLGGGGATDAAGGGAGRPSASHAGPPAPASVNVAAADLAVVLAFPGLAVRFLGSGRRLPRNPMLLPLLAYLAVCVVSTVVNGGSFQALTSIAQMVLYTVVVVYAFAIGVDDPDQMRPAFYALLATNLVIAVAVLVMRSGYVLGMHKNAVGAELSYAVTIAAELWLARAAAGRRRRGLTAVLLVLTAGLVFTLSRGAWLGAAVGVVVLLLLRGRVRLTVVLVVVLVPVVAVCWLLLPKEAKDYATNVSSTAGSIGPRYLSFVWSWYAFLDHPILGMGADYRKLIDATNIVIDTMAETGVLGLVTFAGVFVAFGRMVLRGRRRLGRTDPAFSLLAIGAALMAGKLAHGCVDHYWSRVMLPVWVAAGLAVYAYNRSLAPPGRGVPVASRGRP